MASAPPSGLEGRRDLADAASGKGAAQRRVNRVRAFRAELDALRADGIVTLTEEQQRAIDAHHDALLQRFAAAYDVDRTETAGQLSLGMRIAAFFAAMALTAAIYSLVAKFWGRFDLPLQATLLCAFPLVSLVAVELAAQRERSLYLASIFAAAAFGTYWLAVGELSQLLGVPLSPPYIWGGALFGLALALPYRFKIVFAGALLALLAALAGSVFQAAGMPWTLVPEVPEMLTIAAVLLALLAPRFQAVDPSCAAISRGVGFGVAYLGLLWLSMLGQTSVLPVSARVAELTYQGVMLVMSLTVIAVAIGRRWSETVYLSAGALTLFMFSRFVDWFWEALPRYVFFLLLAVIAFAWLFALRRVRRRLAEGAV